MKKFYDKVSSEAAIAQVSSRFVDGWIIMLALGGLSHQLNIPTLAIGYWSCVLIQLIATAVMPSTSTITGKRELDLG
jgi:hypothetical protein